MQRLPERSSFLWRHIVVLAFVLASFALALSRAPFGQDQSYHAFADSRSALGIPNFGDVASNLVFIIAGLAGLWVCFVRHPGKLRHSWIVMFAGIASVGVASAYYHWDPNDQTLVWDRATLDRFISNPDQVIPGNSMKPYSGLSSAEERAKIITFLEANGGD